MADVFDYKCPCCAGKLEFNSGVQKMKCPYCDNEFEMELLKEIDEEINSPKEDVMEWREPSGGSYAGEEAANLRAYICQSCGGEVVSDATTSATSCPYCDSPIVMKGQVSGELKPDLIIPFKFDKEAAKQGLLKHLQGKKLLPKVFKDENHIDEVKGIYVPFWIFDADVDANYTYKASLEKRWEDENYRYKETSHYSVYRKGNIAFQGIPVDGSAKMDDTLMESLEPFHLEDAVDFQTAYLAGYFADKYDVTSAESIDRANQRVRQSTELAFRQTLNQYTYVEKEAGNIKLENGTAKYALYPVWILNTTWKDEKFVFAMNGQTGKFVGDLPMDMNEYWKWVGIYSAMITLIAFICLVVLI